MRVALAQFTSGSDPGENLAEVAQYCARAAEAGARLIVLPEATMRAFGAGALLDIAEDADGAWADGVAALSAQHDMTIVAGMFRPAADGLVYNTALVTHPDGRREAYDKIHLFDAFDMAESDTVAHGDDLLVTDVDGVGVGVAVCYELRFAEQFRALARAGAALIVCPASWGAGDGKAEAWNVLTKARALDSTSFVVACDQTDPAVTGDHDDSPAPTGIGLSVVVDPAGRVLAQAGEGPELLVVDLDPGEVAEARRTNPVLEHGRVTEP